VLAFLLFSSGRSFIGFAVPAGGFAAPPKKNATSPSGGQQAEAKTLWVAKQEQEMYTINNIKI